ncbi:hypothetical protein ACN47E_007265 [Coniothyrium glycines]
MSAFQGRRSTHDYQPLPRASFEVEDTFRLRRSPSNPSWLTSLARRFSRINKFSDRAVYTHYVTPRRRKRSVLRLILWSVFSVPYILVFLVVFAAVFFPSYTVRPAHYQALRQRALNSTIPGRANPHGEKVFISASLHEDNGHLTSGGWGRSVLELVDLLGPENVHLSIYEDNADEKTKESIINFRHKTPCNSTIVVEDLDLSTLPRITLPSGETRLKRIAFLAKVRNRALAPIDDNGVKFDRVLFLNDVNFNPIEAVQLLFATNVDSTGRANYAAACAVDFIMPFKFYDRFATRDFDGYITGLVFFPWFTSAGTATSRNDVLSGTDAVRVRSCWSGMVAYEAAPFQDQTSTGRSAMSLAKLTEQPSSVSRVGPLQFRYNEETFWESSECCLINADLQYRGSGFTTGFPKEPRIYMNPFVRVAYDENTLAWLSLVRRPERLYSLIHDILNYFVGFPVKQERGTEEPGQIYTNSVWEYDDPAKGLSSTASQDDLKGHWKQVTRIAEPGGFCGSPNLLVINENPQHGEGPWSKIFVPHPPDNI